MPISLEKSHILLVEGKDEVLFFEAFLKHLKIENAQIIEVCGKNNFKNAFPAFLNMDGFSEVVSYAIVRDADNNADSTFTSIIDLLKRNNQPVPKKHEGIIGSNGVKVGIYIVPGDDKPGMLESLCLDSVSKHPIIECVNTYISCLESMIDKDCIENKETKKYCFPGNLPKAKMHAFLAGQNKFVPGLGIAARKGYFDLNAQCFKKLRDFVCAICDTEVK